MIIVPWAPPLHHTRHSRELGKKIEQLVREYQRDHPDVKESDVRAALSQLAASGEPPETTRRKRALGVVIATLLAGSFAAMASTAGGQPFNNDSMLWIVVGVVAAVCGIAIAVIRTVRRA
jgi:hypothetical protein